MPNWLARRTARLLPNAIARRLARKAPWRGGERPRVLLRTVSGTRNVGDLCNIDLLRQRFSVEPVPSKARRKKHLLAIGSLIHCANRQSEIWGTGVMHPAMPLGDIRPDAVHALRGKLTHAALRKAGVAVGDAPLGDPAFLMDAAMAARPAAARRFEIGLAAHYSDRKLPWVVENLRRPEIADLDVRRDPADFLARLLECRTVVSSALHGLILAEALGVPNVWVELSDRVVGEGFKFRDWFSLAGDPQPAPRAPTDDIAAIAADARLHDMRIDRAALAAAFPRRALGLA
jgi:hypothetical protein